MPAEEAERVSSPFQETPAEKAKTPEPETPAAALSTPPNERETTAVVSEDPVLLTGILIHSHLGQFVCTVRISLASDLKWCDSTFLLSFFVESSNQSLSQKKVQ